MSDTVVQLLGFLVISAVFVSLVVLLLTVGGWWRNRSVERISPREMARLRARWEAWEARERGELT